MAGKTKEVLMSLRRMMIEDNAVIEGWYEAKGEMAPPWYARDFGFIVELNGKPAGCGWLLRTMTKTAFCEFFQTDPGLPEITQARVLRQLAQSSIVIANKLGFRLLIGIVPEDKKGLGRYYMGLGSVSTGKKFHIYYKGVG